MLNVEIRNGKLIMGELEIVFHRTLRLPDDGGTYPLPPSLGHFPIHRVEDYADTVPQQWLAHGGVFIPMYQREALWMGFNGNSRSPQALKVAAGMVNAVDGKPWHQEIVGRAVDQDYMVIPGQQWLDGFKTDTERVKQFVAMPLGRGYTVEGQLSGEETHGGLQLVSFAAKPGKIASWSSEIRINSLAPMSDPFVGQPGWMPGGYPDMQTSCEASFGAPSPKGRLRRRSSMNIANSERACASYDASLESLHLGGAEMGLAAGGSMRQKIYTDPHGAEVWDMSNYGRVFVHIVNSEMYEQITGRKAPASPVTRDTYREYGYQWYDLYDEHKSAVPGSDELAAAKTVREIDEERGIYAQNDETIHIPDHQVKKLPAQIQNVPLRKHGSWPR